jgi:hypothetical protein
MDNPAMGMLPFPDLFGWQWLAVVGSGCQLLHHTMELLY